MNEDFNTFKFRAECLKDAYKAIKPLFKTDRKDLEYIDIRPLDKDIPDVVVTISTNLSKEDVLDYLRMVPDGHVMVETLEFDFNYTGERDYERQ